jgi:predicted RND superfamily exporter protein
MKKLNLTRVGLWIDQYPKKSLALCLLLFLCTLPGLLNIQMDYGVKVWLKKTDPLLKSFNFFQETFGNDDSILIALHRPEGVFHPELIRDIHKITNELWTVPDVVRVDSLSNFTYVFSEQGELIVEDTIPKQWELHGEKLKQIEKRVMQHEQMPGRMIDFTGQTASFLLRMRPYYNEQPDFAPVVEKIETILEQYREKGYRFYTVGTAQVTETFRSVAISDLLVLIPLLNLLIFLVLVLVFKNKWGVILPFTIIGLTLSSAMGLSGMLGIKLNNLSGMVPTILIAICIADSIHVLQTFRRFQSSTDPFLKTLQKNLAPTFLTTVSTTIGFFSLYTNDLVPIQDFGILCGLGCLFAWFYSIFGILPLLKIFAPKKQFAPHQGLMKKGLSKVFPIVQKYPLPIIFSFLLTSIVAIGIAIQNEVNSNPFDYFAENTHLHKSNQFFLKQYKGFNGLEMVFNSGRPAGIHDPDFLEKIDQFQTWLKSRPYINQSYTFLDDLKQINRAANDMDQAFFSPPKTSQMAAQLHLLYTLNLPPGLDLNFYIDVKEQYLRGTILWNIQNSKQCLIEAKIIENKAKELGLNAFATGQEYLFQGMNSYVVNGYFTSMGISLLFITLMMIFVTKSLKVGILSILPNIIPITFGAMAMSLLGRPIDVGTVLVASVCFGIAIDDTIHFLTSYNKYIREGLSPSDAIKNTIEVVGSALSLTTFILFLGFGVFAIADFVPNFNFGVFSAFVLVMALATDLLFLPALLIYQNRQD